MTKRDLPPNIPPLNFWEILGIPWSIDANRPTADEIKDKMRKQFDRAQEHGALTSRVAWEISESAKVLLDPNLHWPTLLNWANENCDSPMMTRSIIPQPSLDLTEVFAREELSKPLYRSEGRLAGPELRFIDWDREASIGDLMKPTGVPSVCIGSLSMNGRLVFAFLDSKDQLSCVAADVDEWGLPCTIPYKNNNSKATVCMKPPFTTINDAAIKTYVSAYTRWVRRRLDSVTDSGSFIDNKAAILSIDDNASEHSATAFSTGKFLWYTTC